MPIISRFYGIIVMMYWRDHNPPHFHARYGDFEAEINIRNGTMHGQLPRRAGAMIQDWRRRHINDLLADWELAQSGGLLIDIAPLE